MTQIVAGSAPITNLESSIINPVKIEVFEKYCPELVDKVRNLYPDGKIFLWALSKDDSFKQRYQKINSGDMLLLKEKGNDFNYCGTIVDKAEVSSGLGQEVWKNPKWTRLLFLKDRKKISIKCSIISSQLGLSDDNQYQNTSVKEPTDLDYLLKLLEKSAQECAK